MKTTIVTARINETILVTMTGVEFIKNPYRVQSRSPAARMTNMPAEISRVDLDFHVFTTWGR